MPKLFKLSRKTPRNTPFLEWNFSEITAFMHWIRKANHWISGPHKIDYNSTGLERRKIAKSESSLKKKGFRREEWWTETPSSFTTAKILPNIKDAHDLFSSFKIPRFGAVRQQLILFMPWTHYLYLGNMDAPRQNKIASQSQFNAKILWPESQLKDQICLEPLVPVLPLILRCKARVSLRPSLTSSLLGRSDLLRAASSLLETTQKDFESCWTVSGVDCPSESEASVSPKCRSSRATTALTNVPTPTVITTDRKEYHRKDTRYKGRA